MHLFQIRSTYLFPIPKICFSGLTLGSTYMARVLFSSTLYKSSAHQRGESFLLFFLQIVCTDADPIDAAVHFARIEMQVYCF